MKKKLWIKIVVWILAILMIGSCVSAALVSIFAANVSAAEEIEPEYVTVGLMYGSDVTVGFETVSTVGFAVHAVTAEKTERFSEEIYTIEIPKISAPSSTVSIRVVMLLLVMLLLIYCNYLF